jgi:energy-coupling factor transporter ATP-binding protein EcfA2
MRAQELVFGWPPDAWSLQQLSVRAGIVLSALGLDGIPLGTPLRQLSDGYKRRAALAVALVRRPALLLLDEPLAGLDWQSRADIAGVLGALPLSCSCHAAEPAAQRFRNDALHSHGQRSPNP